MAPLYPRQLTENDPKRNLARTAGQSNSGSASAKPSITALISSKLATASCSYSVTHLTLFDEGRLALTYLPPPSSPGIWHRSPRNANIRTPSRLPAVPSRAGPPAFAPGGGKSARTLSRGLCLVRTPPLQQLRARELRRRLGPRVPLKTECVKP